MNEKRTYGIEIELLHGSKQAMADALCAAGIKTFVEGYNHITKSWWKIVSDGSIQGVGYELVSPILKGQDGIEQIETVCRVLAEMGATVNRSCGLHVHHDAKDFNNRKFHNLLHLYSRGESVIDSMLPQSRRGDSNRYCRSLLSLCEDDDIPCYRYYKVNFAAFHVHGTIEFRQHNGTVEAQKIISWILLTQKMMDRANRKVNEGPKFNKYDLYQTLGLIHKPTEETLQIKEYFDRRISALA